jgi:hypothetical protein
MSEGEAERELFDHLVAEFGDRGQDAVQFLRTARRLAAEDPAGELPRAAGAAARPSSAYYRPSPADPAGES